MSRPISYRSRLALAVGSLRSRLLYATDERLAADAARTRKARAEVYEINHGRHFRPYRQRLAELLPRGDRRMITREEAEIMFPDTRITHAQLLAALLIIRSQHATRTVDAVALSAAMDTVEQAVTEYQAGSFVEVVA